MIRQDFSQLPPKMFLMQVMDTLSKVYVFLWEKKNEFNKLSLSWKELSKYFNKNSMRTSLRRLNSEGLLNYEESDYGVTVEITGWDNINA
jgi:hypothetical protein